MKLVLAFIFCSFTCCLAVPFCSLEELEKCIKSGLKRSEEDDLKVMCRQTECSLEYYSRCGSAAFKIEGFSNVVKVFQKFVDNMCYDTPIRRKYLENAECLKRVAGIEPMAKFVDECDIRGLPKEEFCRKSPICFRRATDYVIRSCGKDAGDAFKVMGLAYFDPYGCLV